MLNLDDIDIMPDRHGIPIPDFPAMPPENISPHQLYALMLSIHSQSALTVKAVNDLTRRVEVIAQDQAGMVETWKTASGVLKFIKGLGALGTALLIIAAFLKW